MPCRCVSSPAMGAHAQLLGFTAVQAPSAAPQPPPPGDVGREAPTGLRRRLLETAELWEASSRAVTRLSEKAWERKAGEQELGTCIKPHSRKETAGGFIRKWVCMATLNFWHHRDWLGTWPRPSQGTSAPGSFLQLSEASNKA